MHKKEVAFILLETKAVTLNAKELYTFASGIKSPIYCDNRILISHPNEREQIVDFFVDMIEKENLKFDVVAGTSTAGIPWAAFLAQKLQKPMVYVKKASKEYGKQKQVEGDLKKGHVALVVEDLISTGSSSLQVVETLRNEGAKVHDCIAIFTYQMKKAEDAFKESKCKLHALSNFSALVDIASSSGYIQKNEKDIILKWNKNPEVWQP